jgi:hypothetical protein
MYKLPWILVLVSSCIVFPLIQFTSLQISNVHPNTNMFSPSSHTKFFLSPIISYHEILCLNLIYFGCFINQADINTKGNQSQHPTIYIIMDTSQNKTKSWSFSPKV